MGRPDPRASDPNKRCFAESGTGCFQSKPMPCPGAAGDENDVRWRLTVCHPSHETARAENGAPSICGYSSTIKADLGTPSLRSRGHRQAKLAGVGSKGGIPHGPAAGTGIFFQQLWRRSLLIPPRRRACGEAGQFLLCDSSYDRLLIKFPAIVSAVPCPKVFPRTDCSQDLRQDAQRRSNPA